MVDPPSAAANDTTADAVARQAAADTSTGRFTDPQEIADLVLYLASNHADNITGSDFLIDGGLVKTLQ
ncbi:SDR family oxidoreductase [Micromonospora sp. CPCC 205371]|nr:SDR family oxidoreductase [Micromonospora sp. CPCC 205371]